MGGGQSREGEEGCEQERLSALSAQSESTLTYKTTPMYNPQVDVQDTNRTQTISVKADMDSPRFDTELIFPLSVECVGDILSGCVVVTLADTPDSPQEPESSSTPDSTLGQVKVPFSTIFVKGKTLSKSVHLSPAFYSLSKTKSMSRKFNPEPKIRLALSFFIGDDEGEVEGGGGINRVITCRIQILKPTTPSIIASLLPHPADVTKLAKNCTTVTELVHEINKVSMVAASSNTGRGRTVSPSKRGRGGRSRNRSRNGTRGSSRRSGSPQRLNTLERIVLASGSSPDYRAREPRYPDPDPFEEDEETGEGPQGERSW